MAFLFRLFNPNLPRSMWLLQVGVLVNFFGNGLVAPFLLIYLHDGRQLPIAVAGSAVALGGITAVTSGLVAGTLIDRVGSRNILCGAMVCNACAYLLYTQVTQSWQAYAVGLLVGVGTGTYGPASQGLTASMVGADNRSAAFAQNRVSAIVGLGAGGMAGGLIAAAGLAGYVRLLQLDAITFLLFAAISLLLPAGRSLVPAIGGRYRDVLRDGPFLRLVALNTALVAAGIAPMLVLLPAFAKGLAHVSEPAIGALYATNTLTIVIAQLPLTRLVQGRSRMQTLRTSAVLWVASWLVCMEAGAWLAGNAAAVLLGAGIVVYALGECLYTSVMVPTATALAPEHLRGRYLGAVGLSWQGGFLIGQSLGSVVLGVSPLLLPAGCAVTCLVCALATAAVDRRLSPAQRLSPVPVPAR